jgi:acetyl-CoA synthetase
MSGLLPESSTYEDCYARFQWRLPERFNIAQAVCDRHAEATPDAPAIISESAEGAVRTLSFGELRGEANRLANLLVHLGAQPGDRVAIHLPQGPECAISHVGVYKTGAIALPLFSLFGPEALEHRLNDSGARILITNAENLQRLSDIREALGSLERIIVTDAEAPGTVDWRSALAKASDSFRTYQSAADDPAVIIYTSGTTGNPKGALHGHRVLLGHLPGVEFPHEFFPQEGDLFWTPADWAWIGGLLDVLLPCLFHGKPVLAKRFAKFEPEAVFELMARHRVRNTFMPGTALRMLRQVENPQRFGYALRSVASGGEVLGADIIDWGRETFGVTINEFYGQTEVNLVVGNNAAVMPTKPGSMGRPIPGHRVAVVSPEGEELGPGEEGVIAVKKPDPVMFLGYWNREEETARKFAGDWCLLGDLGSRDEEGYFWFKSRDDDVINSSSYRIGPTEVEACLLRHPAVALAGVIGSKDEIRGEVVKAYLVLAEGHEESEALRDEIQAFVRQRLSAHEYPRQIRFIDEMPLTISGKIRRVALRELDAAERQGGQKD